MKDQQLIYRLNKSWNPRTISIQKAGGQTNRNYIISFKGRKFFVRIPWKSDVIDRRIEGKNILALSKNKTLKRILPRYFMYIVRKKNIIDPKAAGYFSVPDGTMITEFMEGREFTIKDFQKPSYQKLFTRLLYTFHTSHTKFQNEYDVFKDEVDKYRVQAQRRNFSDLIDQKTVAKLGDLEKEAKQRLLPLRKGVATHNDIIFQNILLTNNGRLYLLDFEYAGRNTKGGIFYDLGFVLRDSFFRSSPISQKTFEQFLAVADRVYKRKIDRSQIYWAVVAGTLVGIWWGVLRYLDVSKKEKAYFQKYVQLGVRRLLALANKKESG